MRSPLPAPPATPSPSPSSTRRARSSSPARAALPASSPSSAAIPRRLRGLPRPARLPVESARNDPPGLVLCYRNMALYCGNMARRRHPKKEVEAALREAETEGWIITISPKGHPWGRMTCPERSRLGCQRSIYSTPRNPGGHARESACDGSAVSPQQNVRSQEMYTYDFTLIVEGTDFVDDDIVNAAYEAGCDDALLGYTSGVPCADFAREAASLEEAALSAIADIESVDGIEVIRIADAGLVSIADIAARTGRTRESVRLLFEGKRGPGGFPAPVTDPPRRSPALELAGGRPLVRVRQRRLRQRRPGADPRGDQRLAGAEAPAQDRRAGALGSLAGALRPDA